MLAKQDSDLLNSEEKAEQPIDNEENSSKTEKELLEDDAKALLQNFLKLYGEATGCPSNLLDTLGLLSYVETLELETTDDLYVITNIDFEEYQNAMLEYVSGECFEKHFTEFYKDVEGKLYYKSGFGSPTLYDIHDVEHKEDDKYSAVRYIVNEDGERVDKSNVEFEIIEVNGEYIINSYEIVSEIF